MFPSRGQSCQSWDERSFMNVYCGGWIKWQVQTITRSWLSFGSKVTSNSRRERDGELMALTPFPFVWTNRLSIPKWLLWQRHCRGHIRLWFSCKNLSERKLGRASGNSSIRRDSDVVSFRCPVDVSPSCPHLSAMIERKPVKFVVLHPLFVRFFTNTSKDSRHFLLNSSRSCQAKFMSV